MLNKESLNSLISKYYLNGLIEAVKWEIKNKTLSINFMSPSGDMLGKTEFNNFPLDDTKIAIFNTTQLNKLLSVISGNLILDVIKTKQNIPTKLNISDSNFNVTYALADPMMIKENAEIEEPESYDIHINLEQEHIDNLIKSKSAVGDDTMLIIENSIDLDGNNIILFTFGENTEYSNKITYQIPTKSNFSLRLPFSSDILKSILVANKNMSEGHLFINEQGLMKLKFTDKKEIHSEYYLVRKADL